jgi:hypothetical protein
MALSLFGIIIICFVVIAFETLLIMFTFFKTPAATFLMASMMKKPVIYIIGKDRLGTFKSFTAANGAAKVKGEGLFALTQNSHTLESGSKTAIYFAFRDQAATLLPEYPAIIQELREKGIVLNHVEDIKDYLDKIKKGVKTDLPVSVRAYKTYRFHDLENMFPFNLDPTFIDATVQCEISKGLKLLKVGPTVMGGIIILLMVGAIAIYIIRNAFAHQIGADDCTAMVNAAKCVYNSAGNFINTTAQGALVK